MTVDSGSGWQYDSEEVFTEKVREYVSHPEIHQKMSRKAAEGNLRFVSVINS